MALANFNIDFMRQQKVAAIFSALLLLAAIYGIAANGLNLGLDFSGGTLVELEYENDADLEQVREVLREQNIENAIAIPYGSDSEVMVRFEGSFSDVAVVTINQTLAEEFGQDVQITSLERMSSNYQHRITVNQADLEGRVNDILPPEIFGQIDFDNARDATVFLLRNDLDNAMSDLLVKRLSEAAGFNVVKKRSEFVGPQVGEELTESVTYGLLTALLVVMVYVAIRFQFKFSVGAVAALAHDVLVVFGLFALFNWDFDLTVVAAILATIGYSLNDTIVVSDRIRENFRKVRNKTPYEIINLSLNQCLGRTLVTSITTLLVLFALYFVGGETIHNFSLGLIIGVVIGTYSSIFVAASVMLAMKLTSEDLIVPVKEGAEFDEVP